MRFVGMWVGGVIWGSVGTKKGLRVGAYKKRREIDWIVEVNMKDKGFKLPGKIDISVSYRKEEENIYNAIYLNVCEKYFPGN